jgi:NADH pyrophosphatase NudC (nudix superfamily)
LDNEVFLSQDFEILSRATAAARHAEAIVCQLKTLVATPDLAETREIEAAIAELKRATDSVSSQNQDLIHAGQALREGEQLLRTWAEQQKLCPTCGSRLDPNLIVVHAGSSVGGSPHV